ncbi:hypothetical protein HYR99_35740 [Candidatus Poribacteria bacterium]|nr:hypothetical protein [Candidatus Poribacteria bacterium]
MILIPVNTYFIMANHLKYWSTLPTTMSLIYNVIITLMVLMTFNLLLQYVLPRFALKQGEFLTIYIMLSVSSAIAGHDMMQTLVPVIPNGFWFATPENEWKELFWRYLPRWLTSDNLSTLKDFYDGETTFYTKSHLQDWLRPILWWTVFLTVLIWVMICLDMLLRKQWIERERLTYPIVRLPLEMTRPDGWLFRSKMMWIGFAIAGGIDLINGLHVFFPVFPEIPVRKAEMSRYFTEKPWDAMGWTPVYILPFGLGLAFLMPLEMSFSLWFFYLFWKGERVLGRGLGLHNFPGFPYDGAQGAGAYLAVACFALFGGRRLFYAILKGLFQRRGRNGMSHGGPVAEKEPMTYRWAVLGLVGGLIFLGIFSHRGGMAIWTIALYFLVYYLLAIGISRIRAEVGPPTHEMFVVQPHQFLTDVLGTRRISHGSLTMMALYYSFNRGYRAHPMPHTLEGFKLAEASQMNPRRLVFAMMLATVVGILAAFWAYLVVSYKMGANPGLGSGGYDLLRGWIYSPTETDFPAVIFIGVGFLFTGFLWWMRTRFPFWPFHPAGYAVASSVWTFGWLWFSVFVSWAIKTMLLKVGGIRLYRKALPLFLGILLGEFIVGGAWVLVRLFWNIEVYSFYR